MLAALLATVALQVTLDDRVARDVPAAPAAPTLIAELQPLAHLLGSCWRASFPDGQASDTHCYTAMLGGRFIRDVHVVEGGTARYSGESIYRWDPRARRIRYDYYASDGGHSSGSVEATPTGLNFPDDLYVGANGATLNLRTVHVRDGEGYRATSSARQPDGTWREMWTMRFTRVGPAPTAR
jgi:hypothetical protein